MLKAIVLLSVLVASSYARPVKDVQLASANNLLGLQLLNHLSDDKTNVFISPFSISNALAMLYSGAKGTTAQEMRKTLGYDVTNVSDQQIKEQFGNLLKVIKEMNANKYELNVANKMVVQKGFDILDSFKNDLVKYYQATIESVDFVKESQEAVEEINKWVSHETHDKIKKLLDGPLSPSTALILLNAIYFKGKFQTMFFKNQTHEQMFFTAEDKENKVQMMNRMGKFNYTEIEELDSKLLEIPYSGDDISLYIVLPNERQGLKKMRTSLTDFSVVEKNIAKLREVNVTVAVPKFKIETSYSLTKKLSELGMKSAFGRSADLSGIDGRRDLQVSDVIHKAYIEVSEEGTEAAAVTGVIIKTTSVVHKINRFIADHPFVFFIRNNVNGMVLFSGAVNQI